MQKSTEKRFQIAEITFLKEIGGQGIEFRCQNIHRKLKNSRFCACTM